MFKSLTFTAAIISTLMWSNSQATEYRITEISHPLEICLNDINDNGIVVGYATKEDRSDPSHESHKIFQWDEQNGFLEFGIWNSTVKIAGINNNGTVAFKMGKHVYLWNPKDGYKDLAVGITPISINNHDNVLSKEFCKIGELFFDADTLEYESVRNFRTLSSFSILSILSDDSKIENSSSYEDVTPIGINDKNHIFLMLEEKGEIKLEICDLNFNPLMKVTRNPDHNCIGICGIGLNNHDDIVGYERYFIKDEYVGVLWTSNGRKIVLPAIFKFTMPRDVNDSQQVVGCMFNLSEYGCSLVTKAFVFDEKHGLQDLNNCIPQNSGWVLFTANAINNRGQIIGTGLKNDIIAHFLLTPISD